LKRLHAQIFMQMTLFSFDQVSQIRCRAYCPSSEIWEHVRKVDIAGDEVLQGWTGTAIWSHHEVSACQLLKVNDDHPLRH
jgi:hypothetical protein